MFSRIAFLHLLRVPCGTGQSGLIQGCNNLWLFQVSEEVCFCRLPPVAHVKTDGALQRVQRAAWRVTTLAGLNAVDAARGAETEQG